MSAALPLDLEATRDICMKYKYLSCYRNTLSKLYIGRHNYRQGRKKTHHSLTMVG